MPTIRVAWGAESGSKHPEGVGKWVPDTLQNRGILMKSIEAIAPPESGEIKCFWLEYRSSQQRKLSASQSPSGSMQRLPWWPAVPAVRAKPKR
ncbi:hypothetical protein EC845_0942 [Comamonas sp. BIGb0124]|nr:hypothetical protein EC845_0942 [Comamonas sp. BIGb0124]